MECPFANSRNPGLVEAKVKQLTGGTVEGIGLNDPPDQARSRVVLPSTSQSHVSHVYVQADKRRSVSLARFRVPWISRKIVLHIATNSWWEAGRHKSLQ